MKILITGNMGYVGSVLGAHLRATIPEAELIGYDMGYFGHCLTGAARLPEACLDRQIFADVRTLDPAHLRGVDAVVHLAAISNDAMGSRFEGVTEEINHEAGKRIVQLAAEAGVGRFVFASSCSIYGFAEGGPRRESDALNPLTAYARSKVALEQALSEVEAPRMVITSLRFSTACGMSDRLRLDLVLNDFVACALTSGEISVLSDGTPWRPLIEVCDMARAIEWALVRDPAQSARYLAVNVGCEGWNHQVRDLAEAVARAVPGTRVSINPHAAPDKRSYRVDFGLYQRLAPRHQPRVGLDEAIARLVGRLRESGFRDAEFRASQLMRLKVLERHIEEGRLDEGLHWLPRAD